MLFIINMHIAASKNDHYLKVQMNKKSMSDIKTKSNQKQFNCFRNVRWFFNVPNKRKSVKGSHLPN